MTVYHQKPLILSKRGKSTQPIRRITNKFEDSLFQSTYHNGIDLSTYFSSTTEARKVRMEKTQDVQKLQIRIATLEKEEEMAKKKIDEARVKAIGMLQK
jgi:hypothetical protein